MADSSRGRGRSRGRARGQQPPDPARRPQDVGQPPSAPIQPPAPAAAPPPAALPVTQQAGGRATHRGGPQKGLTESMAVMRIAESGAAGALGTGRGSVRGRRRDDTSLHTKPQGIDDKRGNNGQAVKLLANYFKLLTRTNWVVRQYHCDFAPTVESPRMRRALLYDHKDKLGMCFLFDGMSDLKTLQKLEDDVTELYSTRRSDGEQIRITVKFTQELAPDHPELLHLFNTQMRRNLEHMDFKLMGRHYFDKNAVSSIPNHNLELWQGVITAIRQHETSQMMVVDTVHKVLRVESVLSQMSEIANKDRARMKEVCSRELIGSIVMTKYNNRTYRVDDIDWNRKPSDSFDTKRGPITYVDYYQQHYEIRIKDTEQPLIVCRPREKDVRVGRTENIYLVPELCFMTGLTDAMRNDFNVMKDLGEHTRIPPDRRVQNLMHFIQRIQREPKIKQEMDGWGIKFDDHLVELSGRVVDGEMIVQGSKESTFDSRTGDFSRVMRDKAMHTAMNLERFAVIVTRRDQSKADDFLQNLNRVCPPMGMRLGRPQMCPLDDDKPGTYLNALQSLSGKGMQLVILIVSNNRKDRYDAIKKLACVDNPVPTQVIVQRTLSKPKMLMSVATKIGIQINCKLGGEPWALKIPLKSAMVVGFDTYHDSSQRGRSVGALVASMNQTFTSWFSKVSFHSVHQELCSHLNVSFTAALRKFNQVNGILPNVVLYYRDGVSDGQIDQVVEHEIPQLQKAYSVLAPNVQFRFAFIVVNKRISTRFFSVTGRGYENPPPGTVIDTEVTRPERYDFYLVSQSVRQGTVSPTQYNIISDSTGLRPDHMQRLTYKLTHLYFNWPGTIRVPAPCQYAHKLAFLVGQSLHREPSENLADVLYYL